ncbi:hypothetical protein CMO88_00515 [Candidatus Woesearchaeota archaeon]|nr:hypothetical protein [Candidatus Woesearchaeota archaeon]|tara:strand:+ start:28640 stop:28966 length:327 start_codon:yes stop_codon:yes gene_type:complete
MAAEKKKFMDIVGSLEYEELVELQRDLFSGGTSIRQIVSNKLKEISATESRTCGSCGNEVNLRVANEFTLIFGTSDTKKRVSFCALDCMEYFTKSLKQLTGNKIEQKN